MRLFTALDLPARLTAEMQLLIEQFRPLAPLLRWSVAANLHVTTEFIGEWPEVRLDELKAALATVPRLATPIAIKLSGLGWFPNPHQPRVFWAAAKAPPDLSALAAATAECLSPLGIARENRPFAAHLTLARIGQPHPDLAPLRRAVAALPSTEFGEFKAWAFHLYLSESGRYTKLASFPLLEIEKEQN